MSLLKLTIATTDYDHFRDFRMGQVKAEGIDLNWLNLGHHECFARFTANREFDLSELSFAKFCTQVTREDSDIIGSPEWAHSAAVYMRGWLHNDMGVKLQDVHWYQAGANSPGRAEKVEITLPEGVKLTRVADKSLSEMLASGEIDCAIIARPPTCFLEGHPDIVRLFPDYLEMEEDYFAKTKVWPIMHIIAMKKSIAEQYPWVARNMFNAFQESKKRSLERLLDPAVSRYPIPWLTTYARKMRDMFNGDTFPYGIEENRATWELMSLYTFQQGISHRPFTPEEIFPKGIMTSVII